MKFSCGIIIQLLITIMMKTTLSHPAEGINIFDFLMSSSGQHSHNISFSPDDGKKFRRSFEQKYGLKGKDLIESLGHGSSTFPEVTSAIPVKNYTKVIKKKRRIVPTTTILP